MADAGRAVHWAASDQYPGFDMPLPIHNDQGTMIPMQTRSWIRPSTWFTKMDGGERADGAMTTGNVASEKQDAAGSKRQQKRMKSDKIAIENGQWYDMSLMRALYLTIRREYWVATAILGTGCRSCQHDHYSSPDALQITAPLVTRIIIQEIASGRGVEGSETGRGVGYGIGVAFGLFSMVWASGLCLAQSEQRLFTLGYKLRAGVSHGSVRPS